MSMSRQATRVSFPKLRERYEELSERVLDFSEETAFPVWIRLELSKQGPYSREVVEFLQKNGLVFHEIAVGNPASDKICRAMYSGGFLGWGPLDDWIGNKGQGVEKEWTSCMQALINRLQVVSEWLAAFITRKYLEKKKDDGRFTIKDLGAGSGSYAFKTLDILRVQGVVPLEWVDWQCVDISDEAVAFGMARAQEDGYIKSVSFGKVNFLSSSSYSASDSERADLIVLVGVLCGMTPADAVRCLDRIKPHSKVGGTLLITTLSALTFEENSRVCQVLVKLGWPLKPKTVDEVRDVVAAAKWTSQWVGSERRDLHSGKEVPGEYIMVHAKLP